MTNDLVKRLHDKIEASKIYDDDITLANIVKVINREELLEESADRIEKLEAALVRSFNHMMEDGRRIEQLEAALRYVYSEVKDEYGFVLVEERILAALSWEKKYE